ncbi:MAG: TniQ family protein [Acidobacteriaceae bacterium]
MLIRPPPQEDELLSSWLVRLAWSNGEKLHVFCRNRLKMSRGTWYRDPDRLAGPETIKLSAAATGLSEDCLLATTLSNYEGTLYERHVRDGVARWIMPIGVKNRSRYLHGQQCCVDCLREDAAPYFRRFWRVAFMVACPRHGRLLLDACPSCGAPISFHEGDFARRFTSDACLITRCSHCLMDLRQHVAPAAEPEFVRFQSDLAAAITTRWSVLPGDTAIYSLAFFDGLHHLLRVLSSNTKTRHIRTLLLHDESQFAFPTPFATRAMRFENLRVHDRYVLMKLLVRVMANWPWRFCEYCHRAHLSRSELIDYRRPCPYWLESEMKWRLNNHSYHPSVAERQAVKGYLSAHGMSCSANNVARWLGVWYVSHGKERGLAAKPAGNRSDSSCSQR